MSFVMSPVMDLLGLTPKAPKAPVAPTPEEIASKQNADAQEQQRRLSRGRTSTMLTGSQGVAEASTTSKMLLGQ